LAALALPHFGGWVFTTRLVLYIGLCTVESGSRRLCSAGPTRST